MTDEQLTRLLTVGGSLVLLIGLVVAVFWVLRRRMTGGGPSSGDVARVLALQGAGRCVEAVTLLRTLLQRGDGERLGQVWQRLELPLLQSLPDCPPQLKTLLRQTLEDCAARCPQREAAKSMMVMRDSLA